jgi:hypothetical protein
MKPLQKTLFIIALLTLSAQTVRHLYVRWIEPTSSVLDKYEAPVKEGIKKAGSLEELDKQYEEARKKFLESEPKIYGAGNGDAQLMKAHLQNSETENALKTAIQEWERMTKEIFELRFFWLCGLAILILGLLCYKREYFWVGLAFITTGISEMIWWTSPSFRWGGGSKEFDKLLTNKIAFSLASIILLLITGHLVERMNSLKMKL